LELSVALGVTLGPISASVDRVGMQGLLSFPDSGGNLGAADLSIKFKPPNGLGISIDAGVLAGGGYLSFDPAKGQYAGVLDAALLDVIQIKIIGLLDTQNPDGSPGYSLLLIITFDFPPIQLSFGFTLTGVGGLVGVNRTTSKDGLHAGFGAISAGPDQECSADYQQPPKFLPGSSRSVHFRPDVATRLGNSDVNYAFAGRDHGSPGPDRNFDPRID
jgi:hypothetical protein